MNQRSPLQSAKAIEAAAQFARGVQLENGGDLNAARSAYERVVTLDPDHAEAIASIAWLDAQAGDSASASQWGERALALDAANVLGRMALAFAGLQDKELDAAGERLAALFADPALTPVNRSIVLSLIGDLNDARGDAARAFKAYDAANAQLKALYPDLVGSGPDSALGHARRLNKWFEKADVASWRHQPPSQATAGDPGDSRLPSRFSAVGNDVVGDCAGRAPASRDPRRKA